MRFMLFGGLVIVVYTGVVYARSFSAGCCGFLPSGPEYAFLVSLEVLVTVLIVFLGTKLFQWSGRCHRLDAPAEVSRVSSAGPVQEQTSGRMVVDEA
jgi:uncharacterized membrane protein